MRPGLKVYLAFVYGVAFAALFTLDWVELYQFTGEDVLGFAVLLTLGLIAETGPLEFVVGRTVSTTSIVLLPLLSCVLLFGPTSAVLFILLTGLVSQILMRKKPLIKATFNVAQFIVSASVAGAIFTAIGGHPLALGNEAASSSFELQLGPFIAFGATFLTINHATVTGAFVLSEGLSVDHVWKRLAGRSGTNLVYDILISPVAIAVAFLYVQIGVLGFLLSILPLLFVRHSYLTNLRLQAANRDLLQALVKAIDTRDPYTSGHSMRVSWLATEIARQAGVSGKELTDVRRAALLHDIGKIELVYKDILLKEHSLTEEEQQIIQSHATRGAELLRSLSSFGEDIIEVVRHHHERWDGQGYPEGLSGDNIPLGARVIMVCDAIDAMLSDRPYRDALSTATVREELYKHSEKQFDPVLVSIVLSGDLLQRHHEKIKIGAEEDYEEAPLVATEPFRL